ncbi:AraC family transcriptional regulator [Stenotrophomonas maltophilia]|uniref:helix-turn-helix domain-containing protein n=1 Tax=Stenotrophomonas maltophilia TaxID=40324 RepID=UPI001094C4C5|nr:helix-turn-helix domain-containing protein [Stenotrophomonas maltophilia]TGW17686.1 AraC family transcriptional regulator [Stenotrophomonas maltophilia]
MTPPDLLQLAAGAAILGLAALSTGVSFGRARRGNHLLTIFFACFAAANLFGLVLLGGQAWLSADAVRWLRVIEVPLVYLLGPLLYGHARALLSPAPDHATLLPLAHLLPAMLAFVISLLNAVAPFDVSPLGKALFQLSFHGWLLQGAPYLLATLWLSLRTSSVPRGTAIQRSGLRGLAIVMTGCWLASAMNRWPPHAAPLLASIGLSLLTTAGMYLLACRVVRQQLRAPVNAAAPGVGNLIPAPIEDVAVARYERSGIDAAQCAAIASALTALMQHEHLHEAPGLDLQGLSQRSGWSPNQVSQALNQGLGQSFSEFVTGFRITAAKSFLSDPADPRSVLDIGLAAGFGSKSTFNSAFKRATGQTPSEYRRNRATSG